MLSMPVLEPAARDAVCQILSGYLLLINRDCVFWSSKLRTVGGGDDDPTVIDLSSQSAEIGTLTEGGRRMIWLKRALKSAGFIVPKVPHSAMAFLT